MITINSRDYINMGMFKGDPLAYFRLAEISLPGDYGGALKSIILFIIKALMIFHLIIIRQQSTKWHKPIAELS